MLCIGVGTTPFWAERFVLGGRGSRLLFSVAVAAVVTTVSLSCLVSGCS